jgi:hypothetical protein
VDHALTAPIPAPNPCTPAARLGTTLVGSASHAALFAVGTEVLSLAYASEPTVEVPTSLMAQPLTQEELGASRSPDGATLALATSHGVLVSTIEGASRKGKARLWPGSELEKASVCVPANGGKRIACVTGGAVLVADSP